MTDSVVIGKDELIRKFRSMGEAVQGATLGRVALIGGGVISNAAKDNIKERGLIRTRTLSRSVHEELVSVSKTEAVVDIGTNEPHGAIHEFGGVIKAKNAKYLAIPVGTYIGSPTRYSDLRLRKTAKGNLVLLDAGGNVQYVLKESVEIQPKPYLRPALDEHGNEATSEMGEAFKEIILKVATA